MEWGGGGGGGGRGGGGERDPRPFPTPVKGVGTLGECRRAREKHGKRGKSMLANAKISVGVWILRMVGSPFGGKQTYLPQSEVLRSER